MSNKRIIPKLPPDFDILKHANTQENILDKQQIIIDRLSKRITGLENDLLDALDMKEGRGPTALSMLQKLIAKLKEENAHLKEELEMYSGYKEGDAE